MPLIDVTYDGKVGEEVLLSGRTLDWAAGAR
jgi:hypothetical protein